MIPNEIKEKEYPEIFYELLQKEQPQMTYKKAFVLLARKEQRDMRFAEACFNLFCRNNFSFLQDEDSPFQEIFFQTIYHLNSRTIEEELAGKFSETGYYKAMIQRERKKINENIQSGLNENKTHRETNPNGTEPMGASAL